MCRKAKKNRSPTDEDLISIVCPMSNDRDSNHILEVTSSSAMPPEKRKEKADKLLYLFRYE